jgi:deoxyhypusine synthase
MADPISEVSAVPTTAAAAVLVKSEDMPADAQKVEELDFNNHRDAPITVEQLLQGMGNMGFQASAVGDAVRIVNDMVCIPRSRAGFEMLQPLYL